MVNPNIMTIPIYIFDLDGTLSLLTQRLHHIKNKDGTKKEKPNWDAFAEDCDKDAPNEPVIRLLKSLVQTDAMIYIVSGRVDSVKQKTIEWLRFHEIPFDKLFMRPHGHWIPDNKLKREFYYEELTDEERGMIAGCFDDRDRIVAMWRDLGLTCYQVAPGNF